MELAKPLFAQCSIITWPFSALLAGIPFFWVFPRFAFQGGADIAGGEKWRRRDSVQQQMVAGGSNLGEIQPAAAKAHSVMLLQPWRVLAAIGTRC